MSGHRVQGGVSGVVTGLGIAILLQQFGVVPLTTLTLLLLPIGMALVGVAMGWPRGAPPATAPSTGAPPPAPDGAS